jgi:EH_Signature domain
MGLRSAMESLRFSIQPLPAQGALGRLAGSLPPVAVVVERPRIDLDSVARRFLSDLSHGANPSGADWNKIAWCLWTTNPAVAQYDLALDALLDRVVQRVRMARKRPYRQLASAYLAEFAANRPALEKISRVLRDHASAAGGPWDRLQARYAIFDGPGAAERIARLALSERTSVQCVLESAGVGGPLLGGDFVRAAHDEGLEVLSTTPVSTAADHVEAIRRWSFRPDKRLIFEGSKVAVARAVIRPFGDQIPAAAERDVVVSFIIRQFGDPRIKRGKWIGMEDVAQVLRRWLTEQSLRQFLDVMDRIAPHHTWRYRRAFWQAYYKADLLLNAWVVFGDHGAVEARRAFGPTVQFGKFRSGGKKQILAGHAVLLLDFGPCIVADWSHTGRCNIWQKSDRARPTDLNAPAYTSDEIMRRVPPDDTEASLNRNDIFSHHGSENYVWQNRVAERLQQLIGTRIPQSDYQVR